jgi:hypothetical protein
LTIIAVVGNKGGTGRRSIHRHCVLEGRSLFQAGRRGEAAADEIRAAFSALPAGRSNRRKIKLLR